MLGAVDVALGSGAAGAYATSNETWNILQKVSTTVIVFILNVHVHVDVACLYFKKLSNTCVC